MNLQKLIASNHSILGSFGEFVYGKICEQELVEYEISHILETDFRVNCRGKLFEIDVKTTRPHTSFAKAKKYPKKNGSICYDLLVVGLDGISLHPDPDSWISESKSFDKLQSEDLLNQWQESFQPLTRTSHSNNPATEARRLLKREIENGFRSKEQRVRVVMRGQVSDTRWKDTPDNLIPKPSQVASFQATIFLQFQTSDREEVLKNILYLDHQHIAAWPTLDASDRQKKKGIERVLDLHGYESKFGNCFFTSVRDLFEYYLSNDESS
ncbi:MAG: hypothetical protein VXX88_05925 [Pseudomonadota bacterium]|nr:hypothetical protein [Pseudomonadota bacterium]